MWPGQPAPPPLPHSLSLSRSPSQVSPILAAGAGGTPASIPASLPGSQGPLPSTPAFRTSCLCPAKPFRAAVDRTAGRRPPPRKEQSLRKQQFVPKCPLRKDPEEVLAPLWGGVHAGGSRAGLDAAPRNPRSPRRGPAPTSGPAPASGPAPDRGVPSIYLLQDSLLGRGSQGGGRGTAQTSVPLVSADSRGPLHLLPGVSVLLPWASHSVLPGLHSSRAFHGSSKGLRALLQGGLGWRLVLHLWTRGRHTH